MEDLKIYQGETLTLNIESDDETAVSVRMVARLNNETPVIDESANFAEVGGKWVALIQTTDTAGIAAGEYEYMLTITYSDSTVKKLPDASECDGDCDLPILTVCEAIDLGVS